MTKTKTEARTITPVALESIDPDPNNPGRSRITKANTKQLAEDMKAHQLLQPVLVRPVGDRYRLVYGERRYQAAKLLGWPSIDAEVRELTDSEAAALQAVENGQREDLDIFAIAEHLLVLTGKQPDGSKPLTQTEAGKCYGIKQAEVSNRIRLLALPESIRQHVRAGHLPIRAARTLLPWADCPPMADAIAKQIAECVDMAEQGDTWELSDWAENAANVALQLQRELCRPMDGKEQHRYDWSLRLARKFDPTPEQLGKLAVYQLPKLEHYQEKGKARPLAEYATNAQLWDKLNQPHRDKEQAKRAGQGRGVGTTARKPKEDASPAAQKAYEKAKAKQRAEQLANHAARWQLRLLRLAAARAIECKLPADDPELLPIALHALQGLHAAKYSGQAIAQELLSLAASHASEAGAKLLTEPSSWEASAHKQAQVLDALTSVPADRRPELLRWAARFALWPVHPAGAKSTAKWLHAAKAEADDDGLPFTPPPFDAGLVPVSPAAIVRMAGLAGLDYGKAWQSCATNDAEHQLLLQGLRVYRKAELLAIAKQLKHEPKGSRAADLVAELADLHNGSQRLQPFGIFKPLAKYKPKASRKRALKKPPRNK